MKSRKVRILSTRPLGLSLLAEAAAAGIEAEECAFIEAQPIGDAATLAAIDGIYAQPATVVFTSMNAVDAVVAQQKGRVPGWRVFCVGQATAKQVEAAFGKTAIAGTAPAAVPLAQLMVAHNPPGRVVFLCGNLRRDELPDILRHHGVEVREVQVYQTQMLPQKVESGYDGILFFSPSAAQSFFSSNRPPASTVLFAIGDTTARELKRLSPNAVVTAEEPGKAFLLRKVLEYYRKNILLQVKRHIE